MLYAASGILGAAAVLLAANAAMRFWLLLGAVTLALGIWLYVSRASFPVRPFGEGAGEEQKRGRQHETVSRPYRSK